MNHWVANLCTTAASAWCKRREAGQACRQCTLTCFALQPLSSPLLQLGMRNVHKYEEGLARQLYEELCDVPGIRILGPPPDVPQVRQGIGACAALSAAWAAAECC